MTAPPAPLPTREEIKSIITGIATIKSQPGRSYAIYPPLDDVADALLARLRPAWEATRLPPGAYEAIFAEHQRDHEDGPNWPREGCLGCRLLAELGALHADLRAVVLVCRYVAVAAAMTRRFVTNLDDLKQIDGALDLYERMRTRPVVQAVLGDVH
jgi:hypothetical protein